MTRAEMKTWAKGKIKGHLWELLIPIIVAGILTKLTIGQEISMENGSVHGSSGIPLGIFFFFVEVGLTSYMVKFINDQEHNFKDLFVYTKEYIRIFLVGLLQRIFIFLWTLLFVIPGIIKAFAYSLVPMLLSDEAYNNLGYTEVLKKSEEMMKGHKMDYFILQLSFIGWYILSPFTLGLLLIWLVPYHETANTKFLYDIKSGYDHPNEPAEQAPTANANEPSPTEASKFCTNCGSPLTQDSEFCSNCGTKVE